MCKYKWLTPFKDNVFSYAENGESVEGLVSATVDKTLFRIQAEVVDNIKYEYIPYPGCYVTEDGKNFADIYLDRANDNYLLIIKNEYGEVISQKILPHNEFSEKYYVEENNGLGYIVDENGTPYMRIDYGATIHDVYYMEYDSYNDIPYSERAWSNYLQVSLFDQKATTDKIDKSYVFKEKEIAGKTYYALFKELSDGESADDYIPTEQPSSWATESITKATTEGLLYNNANCRYKDAITRQDFCILAMEAYCKSQGMEIDEYIKANNINLNFDRFTDTDNAYVLLANELGVVSGTSDTEFSASKYITRQEAAVMLNNIAKLENVQPNSDKINYTDNAKFSTWASDAIYNVSAIRDSKGTAVMSGMADGIFSPWSYYTREQAYVTIYRLYEICCN